MLLLDSTAASHFTPLPYYVIGDVAQRDIFSGEMMTLPMPLGFYSHINTGYAACPAILVNMPPPPPQGIFKSSHGPMVFQHFPRAPGTIHYHPEPTPTTGNMLSVSIINRQYQMHEPFGLLH